MKKVECDNLLKRVQTVGGLGVLYAIYGEMNDVSHYPPVLFVVFLGFLWWLSKYQKCRKGLEEGVGGRGIKKPARSLRPGRFGVSFRGGG